MRKLVAGFAISVDGYLEGENGEFDWITIDPEINFAELMKRYDTYFLGRKTYEKALLMGPASGKDAHYVFSTTLQKVNPPYQLIKENVAILIKNLKQQPGKDIAVFGGADLLTSLLDMKLVDEISLSIIPVLLGAGKHFVGTLKDKTLLSLKESKVYNNGTVVLSYDVINDEQLQGGDY